MGVPLKQYSIFNSNRDVDAHWGKNCFNSSFPTATANYMFDNNINDYEMTHKMPTLIHAINDFEKCYYKKQKPLLMQTLWKTQGQSPLLDENAFDIVIWIDYAFSRLFLDGSDEEADTMKRGMRASARMARCIWELSKSGKIHVVDIYRQMAFSNQTDKEFAVGGTQWRRYVNTKRINKLALPKDVVNKIIEPGYIDRLMPERRFDQTLYFTMRT